ncbi:hypothetical protein BASA81_015734 [Batrachochytrium salamandrivorans]|nr:hypothetical protein BASA81_015734 [Batrachochytrium salamandrivorans]
MLLTTLLRQLANNPPGVIVPPTRSLESNTLAFPSVAKWFARCPINEVKSNHALLFAQISLTRLETDGEDPDVLLRVLPLLEQVLEFKGFEDFSLVLTRLAQLEVDNSQAWFRHCAVVSSALALCAAGCGSGC